MGNCQKQQDVVETAVVRNYGPVNELKIYNYVWQNAYQGLFDYESPKVQQKCISSREDSIIVKQKNQINVVLAKDGGELGNIKIIQKSLFQIIRKTNYFKIIPIYIELEQFMLQKLLWLIVRTLPNQKYTIAQRDIIKFGKQKIKIKQLVPATLNNHSAVIDLKQIKVTKQIYDDLKFKDYKTIEQIGSIKKELGSSPNMVNNQFENQVQSILTANEINCRICLQPGTKTDPLIAPCKCIGSVRYIHLKCLRTWLGKRLNISKQKCCITLNWQKLSCQMCQQAYKYRIYLDNKKFYTVQIPKPQKPYIVFEVMKRGNEKTQGKIYHFVSLSEKNSVSIGRKKDVDVRISDDISVSRHHGSITYDSVNHRFLLSDNKSKFGTLVLVKRNLCIRPHMKNIGFQIGTQVYRFQSIRGPLLKTENQEEAIEDRDEYLNIEDEEQDEMLEEFEGKSDDSEQDFDESQDIEIQQPINQGQIEPSDSPVLRRSQTNIERNVSS